LLLPGVAAVLSFGIGVGLSSLGSSAEFDVPAAITGQVRGPEQLEVGRSSFQMVGEGAQVTRVGEGSRLEAAGIRPGDVITRVGDVEVRGLEAIEDALVSRGSEHQFQILRGSQSESVALPAISD
jgi:S1-C subfamily serine protease